MTARSATPSRNRPERERNLNPILHQHIHPEDLPNLAEYRYSGTDLSFIGKYIGQPYWNFVVKFVPMDVAPNLITLIGFLVSTSSTILVAYYFLYLEQATAPAWVWFYCAFSLLCYQTLDAIDGKHARRTGTGSPMGELFDHGCDAFFTPLLQFNVACALNLTPNMRFLHFTLVASTMLLTIWEQFSTGTLDLGYINGPNEGILITVWIFLMTGLNTSAYWSDTAIGPYTASFLGYSGSVTNLKDFLIVFVTVASVVTAGTNLLHAATRPSVHPPWRAVKAILPTLAALLLYILVAVTFPELHYQNPFVIEMCFGLLSSYTATRMTVARLCKMKYNPWSGHLVFSVIATIAAVVAAWLSPQLIDTTFRSRAAWFFGYVFKTLMVFGVWQYCHLIGAVFYQISTFLKINILTMTAEQKKKSLAKGEVPPMIIRKMQAKLRALFA